jgi:hypothetical protein
MSNRSRKDLSGGGIVNCWSHRFVLAPPTTAEGVVEFEEDEEDGEDEDGDDDVIVVEAIDDGEEEEGDSDSDDVILLTSVPPFNFSRSAEALLVI